MKRIVLVAMCLCALPCLAQTTPPLDIKTLKAKYEQGLAAIQEDTNKALTNSVQGYADALKALGQKLQGAGDLDGILAVKKEAERFGNEKAIPEGAVVADCVALKDLQLKWQKMPDTIDISKSKKIVTLSRSHIAALEEVKKQLTMQGKVDEAVEAKNEIERVRTSAEVTTAEFVLTNAGIDLAAKTVTKVVTPARTDPLVSLRSSLILYYSFERDEGKRVTDKSGKGHTGKVYGAKWAAKGIKGGAYQFDGVDDHVDSMNSSLANGLSEVTLSVWACTSANVPYAGIVTACSQNSKDLLMMSEGPAGRRQVTFYVGNGARYDGVSAVPPGVFAPKGWHHLAGTWKSLKIGGDGLLRMYFDGILNSTSTQPLDGVISQTTSLKIGWDDVYLNVPESRRFKGLVDEVMIYDSALSETEVKQIYDAQK